MPLRRRLITAMNTACVSVALGKEAVPIPSTITSALGDGEHEE